MPKIFGGQFPNVEIQGKGLVATEAFVSLPFHEGKDPVLAVTSHFLNFRIRPAKNFSLAHELIAGNTYRVIVTTGGGLYRYPLGDLVRITGFIQDAPCLRFIGREANVSDLFGEKLQGTFVEDVIRRVLAQQASNPVFSFWLRLQGPCRSQPTHCFLEADAVRTPSFCKEIWRRDWRRISTTSTAAVWDNFPEPESFKSTGDRRPPRQSSSSEMLSRGIKLGDIKMGALDCQSGWEQRFSGQFVS